MKYFEFIISTIINIICVIIFFNKDKNIMNKEKIGTFKIEIESGNKDYSPSNFDISDLKNFLTNIEYLLFPDKNKKNRAVISYEVKEGSVKHIFQTSLIAIVALTNNLENPNNLDKLEKKQKDAINFFQSWAKSNNKKIDIFNNSNNKILEITPTTEYKLEENYFKTVLYVYGKIIELGGKKKCNIHLDTDEYGIIIIDTPEKEIKNFSKNMVYEEVGIKISVEKDIKTKKIRFPKFIKMLNYNPNFNISDLEKHINKFSNKLKDIDVEAKIMEIRSSEI